MKRWTAYTILAVLLITFQNCQNLQGNGPQSTSSTSNSAPGADNFIANPQAPISENLSDNGSGYTGDGGAISFAFKDLAQPCPLQIANGRPVVVANVLVAFSNQRYFLLIWNCQILSDATDVTQQVAVRSSNVIQYSNLTLDRN